MNNKVMIVAGEASGDLHGSGLVREMLKMQPGLEIFGVGGDRMKNQGVRLLYHINEMSVLGFWDVMKRFAFFRGVYRNLVSAMDESQPDLLILIDYPGMNLKLARAAKEQGIKVFYYIAPQVWAWGANRIQKMVRLVDKMAVIIPFEEKMFQQAGIDAKFVGHPLLETVNSKIGRDEFFQKHGLNLDQKVVGLLPGSRILEVKRLLPEMLQTVRQLQKSHPEIQTIISKADSVALNIYQEILQNNNQVKLVDNSTYEIMKHSDLLIVASGTATLESALFNTPLIVVYKVDPISYLIGKQLVKIDTIGLVNVIAERKIVPEFIQHQFRKDRMLPEIEKLLFDKNQRAAVINNLKKIKKKLGIPGASTRSAELALATMNSKPKS
jgi:lipid-A-disaccharide synthase